MRITIHRGIDQIGGCITEISTAKSKVLIDLGHNLPQGDEPVEDKMDNPATVETLCAGCDAIFYTHYHGDHVDLFHHVPESVPQYIGPLAKRVMAIKLEQLSHNPGQKKQREADVARLEGFRTFEAAKPVQVGEDIRITPYFVSHSAADAYMFLIEADSKRVLHTGDFRGHGYLSKNLLPMLRKYVVPQGVDVLICEGTMLNREEKNIVHENDLKIKAVELLRRYKYVFVLCSSTDMDRLATFHAANRKMCHRPLVCDEYQKNLFGLFTETAGKESDLYQLNYKVYSVVHKINKPLHDWMLKDGFTMLVRVSDKYCRWVESLLAQLNPDETVLVYSMFRGYILPTHSAFEPKTKTFVDMFPNFEYLHTSGHATTDTLAEVCRTLNPRTAIIPIHREKDSDFATLDIGDDLRSRITTTSQTVDEIEIVVK